MALRVGIIGGTGLYQLPGSETIEVETPFGTVDVEHQTMGRKAMFFVARHGADHTRPAHAVNHRANLSALAAAHCDYVLGIHNVGGLVDAVRPGTWVVPEDFLDLHRVARAGWSEERAVHTDFSQPYCPTMRQALSRAGKGLAAVVYAGVDGPRFETRVEVQMLARSGAQVVGMTGVPEAVLAHERGLCYASLSFVGNAATGLGKPLRARDVQSRMARQAKPLLRILDAALGRLPATKTCSCASSAAHADLSRKVPAR